MLKHELIHPPLIEALALAGHGDRILLADGNYPYLTMIHPSARLVHLNLAPGRLTVTDVLAVLLTAVNIEGATMMKAPEEAPIQQECQEILGPSVVIDHLERFAFYDIVRSRDVGLVIATGEERIYGNLLLTIGLR